MKNVQLLESVYTDFYQEVTKEVIGIFSNRLQVDKAIYEYKQRKIKYNAECLLENTTFAITLYELDKHKGI